MKNNTYLDASREHLTKGRIEKCLLLLKENMYLTFVYLNIGWLVSGCVTCIIPLKTWPTNNLKQQSYLFSQFESHVITRFYQSRHYGLRKTWQTIGLMLV